MSLLRVTAIVNMLRLSQIHRTAGPTAPIGQGWECERQDCRIVALASSSVFQIPVSACAAPAVAFAGEPLRMHADFLDAHRLLGGGQVTAVDGVAGQVRHYRRFT